MTRLTDSWADVNRRVAAMSRDIAELSKMVNACEHPGDVEQHLARESADSSLLTLADAVLSLLAAMDRLSDRVIKN